MTVNCFPLVFVSVLVLGQMHIAVKGEHVGDEWWKTYQQAPTNGTSGLEYDEDPNVDILVLYADSYKVPDVYAAHVEVSHRFQRIPLVSMTMPLSKIQELADSGNVERVELDTPVYMFDENVGEEEAAPDKEDEVSMLFQDETSHGGETMPYGIPMTEADVEICSNNDNQECIINLCIIDSGVAIGHEDIVRRTRVGLPPFKSKKTMSANSL